jgi:hypothetical protein
LLHDVHAVDEGGPYLSAVQPDLLGEAMVLRMATEQADEAWIENNLGNLLSEVGQRKAALDATREAAMIRSALQAKHPRLVDQGGLA